jgi:TonB family protein
MFESHAKPNVSEPARRVEPQSGAFDATANASARNTRAVSASGAFDSSASVRAMPSHAVAAGSGFGDTSPAQAFRSDARGVASTDFGAVSAGSSPRRTLTAARVHEPIEILEKPKPVYTEEARRLRIQGEVVLEVLFRSTAQASVLRVVRGLGHGLDASAQQAAAAIRFHPAAENGRPIDSILTVKIEFQLAD